MVSAGCYCGRSGPKMRRCGFKGWSCGRMCRKVLTCKLHVCEENCHDGTDVGVSSGKVMGVSCGRGCGCVKWEGLWVCQVGVVGVC